MKMFNGKKRNVYGTPQDKNSVIAGIVDMDKGLPVIAIHMGKETIENVLLDGGSRMNLITEEEVIWLGMQTPLPAPFDSVWQTKL
jgi:hypothetical protein